MSYFWDWYAFGTNSSKQFKIKKGKNYVHNYNF